MKIKLDVEPIPKGVARVRFVSGRALTYYSWNTTEAMDTIRSMLTTMNLTPFPAHIPIRMEVTFWRTKSKWLKKKETMPFRKPDNTNYIKLIEDCLSPIVVPDDAQITTTLAKKRWSSNGHGYIEVELQEDTIC